MAQTLQPLWLERNRLRKNRATGNGAHLGLMRVRVTRLPALLARRARSEATALDRVVRDATTLVRDVRSVDNCWLVCLMVNGSVGGNSDDHRSVRLRARLAPSAGVH